MESGHASPIELEFGIPESTLIHLQSQTPLHHQLARFVAVGTLGNVIQYLVLWLGVSVFGFSAAISSGAGYILRSVVNYLPNYHFTFQSNRTHREAASRYYTVLAIGWCINTGLMWLLVDHDRLNYWVAQTIATAITFLWNFSAIRSWAFKRV